MQQYVYIFSVSRVGKTHIVCKKYVKSVSYVYQGVLSKLGLSKLGPTRVGII